MATKPRMTKRIVTGVAGVSVGALLLVVLLLVVPGTSPGARAAAATVERTTSRTASSIMTVGAAGPTPATFNPFIGTSGGEESGVDDFIYEPLLQYNELRGTQYYPWLATSYKLIDGNRTLVFYLRKGVTFSNGLPFNSADVVYTFNILKQYPALNPTGVQIKSVKAVGLYEVVVSLPSANYNAAYDLGGTTLIVPKALWGRHNPEKWTDPHPVGTGPYLLKGLDSEAITLVRNPHYWQKGLPKVDELRFPEFESGTSAELALEAGELDWTDEYLPYSHRLYVARDPKYRHFWYAPLGIVSLVPNMTVYPLNKVGVREAISDTVDRKTIGLIGESGAEEPATSPTGLVLPNQKADLAPQYAHLTFKHSLSAARNLLRRAGLRMGSDGYFEGSSGRPITLTITDPSDFPDYMSDGGIIVQELKAIGLKAAVKGVSVAAWAGDLAAGTFDLSIDYSSYGPGPFFQLQPFLDDALTAPIGKTASGDPGRFRSSAADRLLNQYLSGSTVAMRQRALDGIEGIMVNELPIIPLVYSADWYQWDTRNFVGFPTPSNPYMLGPPLGPGAEYVILHVRPRG